MSTNRSNWAYEDENGVTWHEYPHADASHALVSWSVAEDDSDVPQELEYAGITLWRDWTIETSERIPLDVLSSVLARAKQWCSAKGKPKGTRMIRRRRVA